MNILDNINVKVIIWNTGDEMVDKVRMAVVDFIKNVQHLPYNGTIIEVSNKEFTVVKQRYVYDSDVVYIYLS